MKLNTLSDNKGARGTATRVGRGIGSGVGKTCGRGQKGQKSRSGGKVMPGFEGGQNPLYRRLPIRGFNNFNFRKTFVTVNLSQLQKMVDDKRLDGKKTVNLELLKEIGFTKKEHDGLKILGSGEISAKLTIETQAISKSAQEKIEKAGGKVTVAPLTKIEKFLPKQVLRRQEAAKS